MLSALPERTPAEIEEKKARFVAFDEGRDAWLLNQIAAIPIAQFYIPKTPKNEPKLIADAEFRRYWTGAQTPHGQATAMAWATGHEKRFFHWFLEFPDIIARGGFDCILGNPPYLGGQGLSGTYGYPFCGYVKWEYAPAGLSDLVVYFVRRIYGLLKPGGFTAFITTNSIKDGDIRKDGLEQLLVQGGEINMAVRGTKWPGRANLVVSLVSLRNGPWAGKRVLDGLEVPYISARLEGYPKEGEPAALAANAHRLFVGVIYMGDGFLLNDPEARALPQADGRLTEVIQDVINGQELSNEPDQRSSRKIINFFDWPLTRAEEYGAAFERVKTLVKPERDALTRPARRDRWWQYAEQAKGLYACIRGLSRCFAIAQTGKHHAFSAVSTDKVFLQTCYVFGSDQWWEFSVLQSNAHHAWVLKYSGALKADPRYLPSQCFVTFPFPTTDTNAGSKELLDSMGRDYHEHRKSLMLSLWLGLTDIYNLFHARDLSPAKVAKVSKKPEAEGDRGYHSLLELRRLHRGLDLAVRDAYDWQDLDLGHDFHEVETLPENDRVRYTISPAARTEVLKRLLALNHARAQAEAAAPANLRRARAKSAGQDKGVGTASMFAADA